MAVPVDQAAGAVSTAPAVERARDAAARESWAEAYTLLYEADRHPSAALGPDDLDLLADAAWWAGHVDESVAARLRAQAGYVAAGDHRGAGHTAWWLYFEYRCLGRPAAAAGWLRRARHHLEQDPDCPEQCYLAWTDAEEAQEHHDPGAALAAARRMNHLAGRSGSPDLIALSRQAHAAVLLANGRRREGLSLLDDAMCSVMAGELSGAFTGWLYCLALTQCMEAADFGRAVEWTHAAMTWCEPPWPPASRALAGRHPDPPPEHSRPAKDPGGRRPARPPDGHDSPGRTPVRNGPDAAEPGLAAEPALGGHDNPRPVPTGAGQARRVGPTGLDLTPAGPAGPAVAVTEGAEGQRAVPLTDNPFRGLCRIHYVEVLDLLGAWTLAEAEAGRVCQEVLVDSLEAAAAAHYAAGEIRRRQGRLDEAALSYAHAHELGRIPQPGLALLRLAQGKADAAVTGLRLALACQSEPRHDLICRARLLTAQTEVALAVGDVGGAATAVAELEALAADATLLGAMADTARGALALARQEPAQRPLRRALAAWLELRIPYDAAQVRMLLAAADRAAGDEEAARLELAAARATFERLGAAPDARRAAALLAGRPGTRGTLPGGLTSREAEVLRLVAAGRTNKDIARTLVISEHTVARHLNNIFAKLDVTSRAAATAYAYAHDLAEVVSGK
ncbi:LuxR C-terminal-related transcriptional regulator [Streptomyces lateritius]|uniref:LuxR C-terminal-related transcriptional regulator n=1 Tax=Streptomyces lateritius TaxID=67313 RepID=A0ABW6YI21_9ACTN